MVNYTFRIETATVLTLDGLFGVSEGDSFVITELSVSISIFVRNKRIMSFFEKERLSNVVWNLLFENVMGDVSCNIMYKTFII